MNDEKEVRGADIEISDHSGRKKEILKLSAKVLLVAAIFGIVFYLIYFSVNYSEANFILSNTEITSAGGKTLNKYKAGDKIYFFVNRKKRNLEASLFILEIHYFEKNEYQRYKQISFELDRNFPHLGASIPMEYFSRPGKYQIKASLDGKVVSTRKIEMMQ